MTAYRLIDFGDGRKLEAIGDYLVDRRAPAAEGWTRRLSSWPEVDARFSRHEGEQGEWAFRRPWPAEAVVDCEQFQLQARPTPFGHIGFFPEQAVNWRWIAGYCQPITDCKVLNLFAYTGASSLAAAAVGAEVTHVDAARPNVEAARRNAQLSRLDTAVIRYIVDDARKYVSRERRRGRCYNLIILDPPAYGHGKNGKAWRLQRDIWPLLEECIALISPQGGAVLLSGHSSAVGVAEIRSWIKHAQSGRPIVLEGGRLDIGDAGGRSLNAGFFARLVIT